MKTMIFLLVLTPLPWVVFAEEPEQKKPIEKDLVLSAKLKSAETIQPGEAIEISLSLTNSSKSATHRVIKPGDASSAGWREPHVHFSVEYLEANGQWTDAPKARFARCGLYDPDWTKDFIDLDPGKTLDLNDWLTPVHYFYEFQKPGNYRIRAHYDYQARPLLRKDKAKLPPAVRNIPVFRLTSAPVTVTVERPLDVRLKVKRNLVVKEKTMLSDLFEVTLVNESGREIAINDPACSFVNFEIQGEYLGWGPLMNDPAQDRGVKRIIKPKEELILLGDEKNVNGLDGIWVYPGEESVNVRAVFYHASMEAETFMESLIKSPWVEINVEKKK